MTTDGTLQAATLMCHLSLVINKQQSSYEHFLMAYSIF